MTTSARPRRAPALAARCALAASLVLSTACCGKPATPERGVAAAPAAAPPPAPSPAATASRTGKGLLQLPHVTLVAVTDWQAKLKPCGCTLDLQRGGVERLGHWLAQTRRQDDSVVVVHAGSLLHDDDAHDTPATQAQFALRIQTFAQALGQLGVSAVALSRWDLAQGGEAAVQAYAALARALRGPLLALGPAPGLTPQRAWLQRSASGVQVGVVAVDPQDASDDAGRAGLVGAEVAELRRQGAQVVVVLANTGLRGARKLARQVKGIDVVVVGQLDAKTEPSLDLEREGEVLLVHATRHGAWAAALTLVPDGGGSWTEASQHLPGEAEALQARLDAAQQHLRDLKQRGSLSVERALPMYQAQITDLQQRIAAARAAVRQPLPAGRLAAYRLVGLQWSAPTDPQLAALVAGYDAEVGKVAEKLAAQPLPAKPGEAHYLGQTACLDCHEDAGDFAQRNPHAGAWKTLQDVAKTRDLDCVACHSTGWGRPGGAAFANIERFKDVQCEACHGPGSLHAADPDKPGLIGKGDERACAVCHTQQHSPRFAYEPYARRLRVPGHGQPAAAKP